MLGDLAEEINSQLFTLEYCDLCNNTGIIIHKRGLQKGLEEKCCCSIGELKFQQKEEKNNRNGKKIQKCDCGWYEVDGEKYNKCPMCDEYL